MRRSRDAVPSMARNLRLKFVLVAMVSVAIVLTVIIGGVNIANYVNIRVNADELIDLIAEYGGTLPTIVVGEDAADELDVTPLEDDDAGADGPGAEVADADGPADGADVEDGAGSDDGTASTADAAGEVEDAAGSASGAIESEDVDGEGADQASDQAFELSSVELFDEIHGRISAEVSYDTRYFTVVVDELGAALEVDTSYIAAVSSDEAASIATALAAAGEMEGFYDTYRYRAVAYATDDTATDQTMYIFVDCTSELESFDTLLWASLGMSALGLLLVLILVLVLSRFAIQPMVESYEKQKRFITDASHELKTPLSVIDAANEVVEIEYGESEWTQSIRDQVARLASLTNRLVFLSRMDEGENGFTMEELSLSSVVEEAVEPYESVAPAHGRELSCSIEQGVTCKGDAKALAQVVELLLDNAVSYSSEGSRIELVLSRHGRRARLTVGNAVDDLPEGDLDRLFERFYRADTSRNANTGGTGVGLSVARAIVEAHKGTVRASAPDAHTIVFTVEI